MRNLKPLPSRFVLPLALCLSWVLIGCSPPGSDPEYRSQVIKREDVKPRSDVAPLAEFKDDSTDLRKLPAEDPQADAVEDFDPAAEDDPSRDDPLLEDRASEDANRAADIERPADGSSRRLSPEEVRAAAMASRAEAEPFVPPPPPKKGSDGVLDLTFDHIKFDMEVGEKFERSMLPDRIEQLSGQRVRLRGFILPGFQQRDIKQFVLVRDNMECCFGPGAALYDCVLVEMQGRGVDFTVRPVTVEGIFDIDEYKSAEGEHLAIYRMDGTSVK